MQVVGGQQGIQEVNMSRARWWEVVGSSEIVKTGISKLSKSEWFKQKTSKKMTLQLEVRTFNFVAFHYSLKTGLSHSPHSCLQISSFRPLFL